ncbi:MAG TPA: type-F conjugative transfer system secretin TraK [Burkholderiaceae bacterium]|nr:type-F conjugative transfer system secretin TraK [Burkholderiaceae bacterium]
MLKHLFRTAATAAVGLTLAAAAHALQTVDVRDGQSVTAKMSLTEQTRIKIDRGRILDVLGDIYDPQRNAAGRFVLEKDDQAGEIFIRLLDPSLLRPVNLFVKGERGTFGLVLQPVDMPLETIVLRDRGEALVGAAGAVAVAQAVSDTPFPKNTSHVRAIKAMWLAMAGDAVPRDVQVRAMNREVALWKEARFVLDRVYVANSMVGELYTLTNTSEQAMVLAEQELYRDGVLGVAIQEHQLRPGQSTVVYVVRVRTQAD